MSYGLPEDKITIVGHVIFDKYGNPPKYTKKEVLESLGLNPEYKTIFFASNFYFSSIPKERVDAGEEPYKDMIENSLKVICEYINETEDVQAIIKLHPQQTKANRECHAEIIRECIGNDSRIRIKGGVGDNLGMQPWDMIPHCDLLIGFETTCITEAFLCGKPTIQTLFDAEIYI